MSAYNSYHIIGEDNPGRFVDAFLNLNEVMDLDSSIQLKIEVTSALADGNGFEVTVSRMK